MMIATSIDVFILDSLCSMLYTCSQNGINFIKFRWTLLMRVFSKKMLREFWEQHAEAKTGLQGWYEEALRVAWQTPLDIKQSHANASILADNRVVFNIQGNAYRLIVKVHYDRGFIYIRFVGTHDEYNRINAETI